MISSKFHTLTNSGDSIVVDAYESSDVCTFARIRERLTSKSLNTSRAAVSMTGFFDSGELVGGNTEETRSKNTTRSDLFSAGSIVIVCLTFKASSKILLKSSTACTPWPAILAQSRKVESSTTATRYRKALLKSRARSCGGMSTFEEARTNECVRWSCNHANSQRIVPNVANPKGFGIATRISGLKFARA